MKALDRAFELSCPPSNHSEPENKLAKVGMIGSSELENKLMSVHSEYGEYNIWQTETQNTPERRPEFDEYLAAMRAAKSNPSSLDSEVESKLVEAEWQNRLLGEGTVVEKLTRIKKVYLDLLQ